jgi:putative transposase
MTQDNVVQLIQPAEFSDPLTEVLRAGARALLAQAVEAEVAAFLAGHADKHTEDGRQRLVRHGHRPERVIMTGLGPVPVHAPRVRDRSGAGEGRIRFTSAILPPYARRSKSLEVLIPILYLRGISNGDFEDALSALLGPDVGGLSASSVARLREAWSDEHARWSKRDLSAKRYVYFWVDGIHVQARLEADAQCLLVIIGATPEGKKELVGLTDGVRESVQSWRELLLDLRRRGLSIGPELAVADGAPGFWQALEEVWPKTRSQRCWVHKTINVLNKLPKSLQGKAKRALQDIWLAETKKEALVAFDAFVEIYGVKYDKAVACLVKDREALLAFYDFPAEHWKHLRTTNPIESTFATIRHRTVRSKGCLSNKTALAMIFKLAEAAEKSWHRLDGYHQLPKVIRGVTFTNGIEVVRREPQAAAA